jgi:hypothetical protein
VDFVGLATNVFYSKLIREEKMTLKDFIERLSGMDENKKIIFYNLENFNLQSRELETVLEFEDHIEITVEDPSKPF